MLTNTDGLKIDEAALGVSDIADVHPCVWLEVRGSIMENGLLNRSVANTILELQKLTHSVEVP